MFDIPTEELEADENYRYWVDNRIHTKPVARSLVLLERLEGIEYIEGRTKGRDEGQARVAAVLCQDGRGHAPVQAN